MRTRSPKLRKAVRGAPKSIISMARRSAIQQDPVSRNGGRNRAEGYTAALNIERGEDTAVRPCHAQFVERDCYRRHAAGGLGLDPSETSLHLDRGYGA
jgi:hypothetical protein